MKQMFSWLATKLSRSRTADSTDALGNPERSEPGKDDLGLPKEMQDMMDDAPIPDRKFLDPSSPTASKTTGFNPYDTAKLHKK